MVDMYQRPPMAKQPMATPANRSLTPNNQAIVKATQANRTQMKQAAPVGGNMAMPATPAPNGPVGPREAANRARRAINAGLIRPGAARRRFNNAYPNA